MPQITTSLDARDGPGVLGAHKDMWSIWRAQHFEQVPDLTVVGGGIVGLFTALFHQRKHPEHLVLVLERGAFPVGASVNNAGFACFGSPSELLADIDLEGESAAISRVARRWEGLQDLRQELGDAAIGYKACGGHELFGVNDPLYTTVAEGFDRLNAELRPILGSDAFRWEVGASERFGFRGVEHVAYTPFEGALDSGALMRTLLRVVQAEGVLFRGTTEVTGLEETPGHVELRLNNGTQLRSSRVVIATNGYSRALLPDVDVLPARGQVLLTDHIPGLRLNGTFHLGEGFYYFRDLDGAVLLGGGRELDKAGESTSADGVTPLIQDRLEHLLREMILPDTEFQISRRWSGIMGFRQLGKEPLVEPIGERMVVAAGLSGMGVAIGIRVAREAADLLDR